MVLNIRGTTNCLTNDGLHEFQITHTIARQNFWVFPPVCLPFCAFNKNSGRQPKHAHLCLLSALTRNPKHAHYSIPMEFDRSQVAKTKTHKTLARLKALAWATNNPTLC